MKPGISNRKSADEERRERRANPPLDPTSPQPEGGAPQNESDRVEGMQTSHKAGSRSVAQKEAGARYPDRAAPPSKKVAGAFGEEPGGPAPRDVDKSLHSNRR